MCIIEIILLVIKFSLIKFPSSVNTIVSIRELELLKFIWDREDLNKVK